MSARKLNKQEAYLECEKRMEYAASRIRSAALCMDYDYAYAKEQPKGPRKTWVQEHQYWLYCMDFVRNCADYIPFRIEYGYLRVNTGNAFKSVYPRY